MMHHAFRGLSAAIVFFLTGVASAVAQPQTADVIVYGATPGGFSAAIAAAREGARVVLLEPTNHVGGLSTGGLSRWPAGSIPSLGWRSMGLTRPASRCRW